MADKHETTESVMPELQVAPGPHLVNRALTTQNMMRDVIIALLPLIVVAVLNFRFAAIFQLLICVSGCLFFEFLFMLWRKRPLTLMDGSACITGIILALSLPATAPWYVGFIGAMVAIGLGKVIFGGLGHNLFNPAMVGRAFVMISFPAALGASAYISPDATINALTGATPLTELKQLGIAAPLTKLLMGNTNGSLGETSAIACLLGGLFLTWRRSISWQIPAGMLAMVIMLGAFDGQGEWSVLHELSSGALLFGAFYIATDPVTSPVTIKGKWIFGAGIGLLVMMMRKVSGYPEGVMFSVLLMNAIVPLINRWTVPRPVGGPTRSES